MAKLQSEPPRHNDIKTLVDLIILCSSHAAFSLALHGEPKYTKDFLQLPYMTQILKVPHLQS